MRNSSCLGGEIMQCYHLQLNINNLASLILTLHQQPSRSWPKERLVSWHPDRDGEVILNLDGSCLGDTGQAGFGGNLRSNVGKWICGFSGNLGISNSLHTELTGLYRDLSLACDRGYRSIKCYSDSPLSIQLVTSEVNQWHYYAALIRNIAELLSRNWNVVLAHTLREGNACADFFAKLGANGSSGWTLFDSIPPGLDLLLLADAAVFCPFHQLYQKKCKSTKPTTEQINRVFVKK